MNIHTLITERKSIRAFSAKEIADDVFIRLFEAARWAPSSMNDQPWRFIAARKNDSSSDFNKLADCLNDSNKAWAKNGAALALIIAKKHHSNGYENKYSWHDVGLAIGNLSLQAMAEGLYMHQMGGFKADLAKTTFEIPDEFDPVSIIVFGYKGDPNELPERLKELESKLRERKKLSELVFSGQFGQANPLFE